MVRAEPLANAVGAWAARQRRANTLLGRYPFAGELLRLYGALVEVQERAFHAACADTPPPAAVTQYVAERVLPRVVDATATHGPRRLRETARERFAAGELDQLIGRWLAGEAQPAPDRYLARASSAPVLEAMGAVAGLACRGPRDERHCPTCGGLPQLAFFAASGDDLLTAPRQLVCARCAYAWSFDRLACAACGETSEAQLTVYAETENFPHIRVDACGSCQRYLLTVDVRKDAQAVPIVDELAALPLDLYAQERGLSKIIDNMMGIG